MRFLKSLLVRLSMMWQHFMLSRQLNRLTDKIYRLEDIHHEITIVDLDCIGEHDREANRSAEETLTQISLKLRSLRKDRHVLAIHRAKLQLRLHKHKAGV